ncbi:putative monovalent cation/H+ antiporter subunit A [Palleronia sp. KMU-117]|uniref:putative monovalent cation/H+ antiporter subunit A n=1 Tax=Palleronia sp. KMU-117 TaxID=3434108 RepID=UPI003D75E303
MTVAGWIPVALAAAIFVVLVQAMPSVAAGQTLRVVWPWVPSLGVSLSFWVDGLSLTFGLLISGIGALVFLYSGTYLRGHPQFVRFMLFLTLFMLSMLGLVLADNLLTLFVFWELTSVTSYLLIGFNHAEGQSRRNALQALLVTGTGGLALLAGIVLIGAVAGTFELSEIRAQGDAVLTNALYLPILLLFLAGAFTKSAQVPFHFWLPNAMAAPTPVSAYLHSATMVKAGVYLLARMHPTLSGSDVWFWTLTIFGAVTAVFASFMAIRQTDMKQTLAYTTLMALGTLTLYLGQDSGYAITAAMTFLVVHSLYKAALFLMAGNVDHGTGTRDVNLLGGLARAMPVTAIAGGIAALSMAGFPPFIGFIGKELKYAGAIAVQEAPYLVSAAVLTANALMFAAAGIVAFRPFWRPAGGPLPQTPHEAPWQMLTGPVILAAAGVAFGLAPALIAVTLIEPGVGAILGSPEEAKALKLWAGVNIPLMLSIATFVLGFALYAGHRRLRGLVAAVEARGPSLDGSWDGWIDALKAVAGWQTRVLQSGVMRRYLYIVFATILVGVGGALLLRGGFSHALAMPNLQIKHWAVVALIVAGAGLTTMTDSRIAAIGGLGAVGIGVALIFIIFGAPDVAITQLLVETLVVVLFAVAALRLPRLSETAGAGRFRPFDAILASAIGTVIMLVMLMSTAGPIDRKITDYFEDASWPEAYGRNIVNVILVDFRALDTFGEIAVVVIAALGAFALLKGGRKGSAR